MRIYNGMHETIKVLVIGLTDTIGGVETYIRNIVLSSNKSEIQFYFIIKNSQKAIFEDEIMSFYNNQNHFFYVAQLKRNPIKWYIDMKKVFNNHEFDLVYINTCTASDILYVYPFNINVPVIMHSHNTGVGFDIKNQPFISLANKRASTKFACSKKAAQWMFGSDNDCFIVNNSINIERFGFSNENRIKIRNQYNIGKDDVVIGNVGRLCKQKNQSMLIDLYYKLINDKNEYSYNTKLMLVGDGEYDEMLKKKVELLGLTDSIYFIPANRKPEEYYCAFDVFVMTSLYEGLPIAGVEAQCCGLYCLFSHNIDRQILICDRADIVHTDNSEMEDIDKWVLKLKEIINISRKDKIDKRREYASIIAEKGYDIRATNENVIKMIINTVTEKDR